MAVSTQGILLWVGTCNGASEEPPQEAESVTTVTHLETVEPEMSPGFVTGVTNLETVWPPAEAPADADKRHFYLQAATHPTFGPYRYTPEEISSRTVQHD